MPRAKMSYDEFCIKMSGYNRWDMNSISGKWGGTVHNSTFKINCASCGRQTILQASKFLHNNGKKCSCSYVVTKTKSKRKYNLKDHYHSFKTWKYEGEPTAVITASTMDNVYKVMRLCKLNKETTYLMFDEDNCTVKIYEKGKRKTEYLTLNDILEDL